ncbi:D-ribose ABC transporter substrate-binding protein [Alkalispirochaeta sphaeroplastigenens]|uniref:D-ribose ABC transporter substrate-binding protein n=1 Tax=Alkalispirochaeta sphaeroplastigenens TaxID=1187066 RepID=A0A2S4JJS2_9SPIO|nr:MULTISPECIES: D-ribose ABC transporter substrate-binding protein [Alkalispirochaeta]POQ99669.1 D-ribose ABC transporter substrate-binding protein [Alkalispirochaeta sphaeroplastigenens]
MKRTVLCILVTALMGGLVLPAAAAGRGEKEADSTAPVLGLSVSTLNNMFFVTLRDGAQEAARELGVQLLVVDSQDDPTREASNIQDLLQRGVSALLINPTDSDAIAPSVHRANQSGVPVFTIDRGAHGGTVVSHIASDNVAGGSLAAEYLLQKIGGTGEIAELQGIPGTSAARDRGAGFNSVVSGSAHVRLVAAQTANFNRTEGLDVFQNILQAQTNLKGVFAHNDEMILGAIQAAEAAGRARDMIFVGFDAVEDALTAVADGKLHATVAQKPAEMGRLGVITALNYLAGKPVESSIPVDLQLVTAENVDHF